VADIPAERLLQARVVRSVHTVQGGNDLDDQHDEPNGARTCTGA
jgi:hypothetical protein